MKIVVAVAQAAPVVLDRAAGVDKACALIEEAGRRGARVVAFPETFIPGYPTWCDSGTMGKWGHAGARRVHARMVRHSVRIPSAETALLCAAARRARTAAVVGLSEAGASGSLWNSLLFISDTGEVLGRHRKLVPTFGERLVWGYGDAAGLRTYDVAGARLGGLVCWEHWMPLARQVLHAEGEEIHVAAWPSLRELHQLASRHYAFEGRTFVLGAASFMRKADLPADFELAGDFAASPDVLLNGGSCIIGPDGEYVVEPVRGREELLTAEIDLSRVAEEKMTLDVGGHYARPDVFDLRVRREVGVSVRDFGAGDGPGEGGFGEAPAGFVRPRPPGRPRPRPPGRPRPAAGQRPAARPRPRKTRR